MDRFKAGRAVVVMLMFFAVGLTLVGCDAENISKGVSYCCPIAPLSIVGLVLITGWKKN